MLKFIAWRLASAVVMAIVVVLLALALIDLTPGNPARIVAGDQAPPAMIEKIEHQLRLDEPMPARFRSYVADLFRGDLGDSVRTGRPVWTTIAQTVPATASLCALALGIAVAGAAIAGTWAGLRPGSAFDRALSGLSAVALAVPPYVVAVVLVVPLAVDRALFPATGYVPLRDGVWEWFRHLLLPAIALSLSAFAELARQVRGALVDAMDQGYVLTARAYGLSRFSVVVRHALRNAAAPVVAVLGLQVGRIIGSAVVVESVFAYPGFGSLALSAVTSRDLPLIQGVVLVGAAVTLLANLLADVTATALNPRLRAR